MTTATIEKYGRTSDTAGFETFTWQQVKKMADAIGVTFYTTETQYRSNGFGIRATNENRGFGDTTKIIVEGNERSYSDNDYTNRRLYTLANENFKMKLELWALKNNVQYVYTQSTDSRDSYFQIVKASN
jgi:hypothetical protein